MPTTTEQGAAPATNARTRPRRRRSLWKVLLRIPSGLYALVVIAWLALYAIRWNGEPDPWGSYADGKNARGQIAFGISAV